MERVWLRPPITAMPRFVYYVLQYARISTLKLLSPLDAFLRKQRGLNSWPPLWLRRHVGPVRNFESSACEMADLIQKLQIVKPDSQVLDIGCGTGVMAPVFARMLGPTGRYLGFDVNRPAIEWCRSSYGSSDARLWFEFADICSPYGDGSSTEAYRFPMSDHEADFILAKSVFTHLLEADTRHYLAEIQRVMAPGGLAVLTSFLFATESRTGRGQSPVFCFGDASGLVRWRWKARPEAAVAYERNHFMSMTSDSGLRLQWLCEGFWPGDSEHFTGQDILVISR